VVVRQARMRDVTRRPIQTLTGQACRGSSRARSRRPYPLRKCCPPPAGSPSQRGEHAQHVLRTRLHPAQRLSASVERTPPDAAACPHFQPVISGMSSPCRAMNSLCRMSLSWICLAKAARAPSDHIDHEVKAIEVVEYAHVKRGGGALLLVAAHVQVPMTGSPVGQAVDQPRVAVEREDDRTSPQQAITTSGPTSGGRTTTASAQQELRQRRGRSSKACRICRNKEFRKIRRFPKSHGQLP
jgi:hypothetical protein